MLCYTIQHYSYTVVREPERLYVYACIHMCIRVCFTEILQRQPLASLKAPRQVTPKLKKKKRLDPWAPNIVAIMSNHEQLTSIHGSATAEVIF